MSVTVSEGPALIAGYTYKLQLETDVATFLEGCTLTAHVRTKVSDSAVLAMLTTANGGLTRLSDTVVEITIPGNTTASLHAGSVVLDVVRTDLEPDRHLAFHLEIPVIKPITRGL